MVRGDASLDVEEPFGEILGLLLVVGVAGVAQLLRDHRHILLTDLLMVVFAVVCFVGQSDAPLAEVEHIRLRVVHVAEHAEAEEVRTAERAQPPEHIDEPLFRPCFVNGNEIGANRLDSSCFNRVGVEERMVQRLRFRRLLGIRFENVANLLLGVFRQSIEGTVAGAVIGKAVRVDPRTVHIAEEIVLG